MGDTLQKRIHTLVMQTLKVGDGAWLVWCDPEGHWLPLLKRVAADRRMEHFDLIEVSVLVQKIACFDEISRMFF
jgi:hypothetical protein